MRSLVAKKTNRVYNYYSLKAHKLYVNFQILVKCVLSFSSNKLKIKIIKNIYNQVSNESDYNCLTWDRICFQF
jgi:hypothetical protein